MVKGVKSGGGGFKCQFPEWWVIAVEFRDVIFW